MGVQRLYGTRQIFLDSLNIFFFGVLNSSGVGFSITPSAANLKTRYSDIYSRERDFLRFCFIFRPRRTRSLEVYAPSPSHSRFRIPLLTLTKVRFCPRPVPASRFPPCGPWWLFTLANITLPFSLPSPSIHSKQQTCYISHLRSIRLIDYLNTP